MRLSMTSLLLQVGLLLFASCAREAGGDRRRAATMVDLVRRLPPVYDLNLPSPYVPTERCRDGWHHWHISCDTIDMVTARFHILCRPDDYLRRVGPPPRQRIDGSCPKGHVCKRHVPPDDVQAAVVAAAQTLPRRFRDPRRQPRLFAIDCVPSPKRILLRHPGHNPQYKRPEDPDADAAPQDLPPGAAAATNDKYTINISDDEKEQDDRSTWGKDLGLRTGSAPSTALADTSPP